MATWEIVPMKLLSPEKWGDNPTGCLCTECTCNRVPCLEEEADMFFIAKDGEPGGGGRVTRPEAEEYLKAMLNHARQDAAARN